MAGAVEKTAVEQPPNCWGDVEDSADDPEETGVIFSALDSFSYVWLPTPSTLLCLPLHVLITV